MRPDPFQLLVPAPRDVTESQGRLDLSGGVFVAPSRDASCPDFARVRVKAELRKLGLLRKEMADAGAIIEMSVGSESGIEGQAYELALAPEGFHLAGAGSQGVLHGSATLVQLLRIGAQAGSLPCSSIRDWPAFERRGWMLDVSRDRIPTMASLFRLVDLLAELKGNELQLYTEHTFAYREHKEVWRGSSPLTHFEIRELDDYCAARGVALVPNQNCLGHFHHWLRHAKYRHLAEVPEGLMHPFSRAPEPFSLCPTDPHSLQFIAELLDELLPCFRSDEVNVGLDETFDLGQGRSTHACKQRGVGRVYLDFLKSLNGVVMERDHRMQFWADVLLEHPELVPEVPKNAVAMLWGYEADHPFDRQAEQVAASGLTFMVCPGTSSWQSLGGRTGNMIENIDSAVRAGRRHGARGVLITDWGDRGHLQPEWASAAGWVLSSGLSWNDRPPRKSDPRDPRHLAKLLDQHVFSDSARLLGAVALDLGRAGEVTGAKAPNASPLSLLLTAFEMSFPPQQLEGLTEDGLERALEHIAICQDSLAGSRCTRPDTKTLLAEMTWVAKLQRAAAQLGLARLAAGGPLDDIPGPERARLAREFSDLADEHGRLWLIRSRPGGLDRSLEWLQRLAGRLGS